MILYAATILVSSFLLFLVQPIIAKQILPWFGGSAAVWSTCLVFFQLALLAGYAYSDASRYLKPRVQSLLHVVLLLASLAVLPILAGDGWKPAGDEDPVWRILGLLGATIGLPYLMLSTTGPLVQSWFAREHADARTAQRVYRFFALSNFGSLVGLLAYPFVIEPWVSTRVQATAWSTMYAVFVLLCAGSAWRAWRTGEKASVSDQPAAAATEEPAATPDTPPRLADYILWLSLSGLASLLLLAASTHITQNVASIPFLWVLPLTLYLLTFVLCFEGRGGRGWYVRHVWLGPTLIMVGLMAWGLTAEQGVLHIEHAVPLYSAGLFFVCMFCHGELAAAKPAPRHLTRFYLMLSIGGAVGGMFVGLVAPRIFKIYWELPLGLVLCGVIAFILTRGLLKRPLTALAPLAALAAVGVCGWYAWQYGETMRRDTIHADRNFYGTLRVKQSRPDDDPDVQRRLIHGVIMHGEQYVNPKYRNIVTSYYGDSAGIGMAIQGINPVNQRVGVIGLGVGTLAGYGAAGDTFRLYEINPQVIDIARRYFFYLSESRAKIDTPLGDARLVLERESPQNFDVLAIDAFSSDAIPVHLITREAMQVYLRHIKPDGAVAFHVTNRYLSLAPVVKLLADEVGMDAILITDDPDDPNLSRTDWVIVTRNKAFIASEGVVKRRSEIGTIAGLTPWTDDFNNLFRILK
ncbi:MAG: spermidine synthase [Burkholderiales bacterium]